MSDFWSDPSSTSILHVCEQRRLWRDCASKYHELAQISLELWWEHTTSKKFLFFGGGQRIPPHKENYFSYHSMFHQTSVLFQKYELQYFSVRILKPLAIVARKFSSFYIFSRNSPHLKDNFTHPITPELQVLHKNWCLSLPEKRRYQNVCR